MSTQKNSEKLEPKSFKNGAKKGLVFRAEMSPKSHKSESWAQDVTPSLQKSFQGTSNSQNMKMVILANCHLESQNQENPGKNAARWRVTRAAHWI